MTLTPLEVGTFLFYLAAVIAIGFVSGRKGKDVVIYAVFW
jgi:hypothetical protein